MPTAPVRVPSRQRPMGRTSISTQGGHLPDDISHLSLAEVRDRLARNERVLQSALFSPSSPTASTSPTAAFGGAFPPQQSPNGIQQQQQPEQQQQADPVRDRLLAVREALRAREAELLAEGMGGISLENSTVNGMGNGGTSPGVGRGGKARALDQIRQTEEEGQLRAMQSGGMARSPISLPIAQTLALGERDFDNQTAQRFAASLHLSSNPNRASSSSASTPRYLDDDIGRSQAAAAAGAYQRDADDDDDDMFDTDEAYGDAAVYAANLPDRGNGLRMDTAKARRAEGYDEDISRMAEDEADSEFAEGNDEYEGGGQGSMGAGPDSMRPY